MVDVQWGDGISQKAGFIDKNGVYGAQVFGSGSVFASHTYLTGGAFTVTVTVSGALSPTGEVEFVVLIS